MNDKYSQRVNSKILRLHKTTHFFAFVKVVLFRGVVTDLGALVPGLRWNRTDWPEIPEIPMQSRIFLAAPMF
jgi:hypothetical protein